MEDFFERIWEHLAGRVGGPMGFRLIIQPTVATILAIRAGRQDARAGRPLYLWSVLNDSSHRQELLTEGWKAVATVFTMAMVMDVVYQVTVLKWFYPLEALIVACLLACVPYLLVRGPVNHWSRPHGAARPAGSR